MAANSLTWTWDDFSGGEADGFKKGPQGSVRVTENVDCRSNDWGIRLSQTLSETGSYVWDVTAVSSVYTLSSPTFPAFATVDGTTGKIYVGNTFMFNMGDTLAAHNKVLAFGWMRWNGVDPGAVGAGFYPYWVSADNGGTFRIHRFSQDYSWASYGVATWTLPNGGGGATSAVIFSDFNRLIIWIRNGLYELTQSQILTQKIAFQPDVEIVGVTKFQDSYRIYYNKWLIGQDDWDSFIAYWDGQSSELQQIARYENSKILSVVWGDAYDYVTYGNENSGDLYAVGWLQRTEVRTSPYSSPSNSRGFTKWGVFKDGILYIPWKNKNGNYGIYDNGNFFRSQNQSLCCSVISSALCGSNKKASSISFKGDTEYVWIDDVTSGNNWKLYSTTVSYNGITVTSWSVVFLPFVWIAPHTEKKLEKIRLGYTLYETWTSIKVYARTNANENTSNSSGWVLLDTVTDETKTSNQILSNKINSLLQSSWGSIEFKIELTQPSNKFSPIFRSLEIEYTDNLYN